MTQGNPLTAMAFCPYLGRNVLQSALTDEHIIPKSIGGPNQLTIKVSRDANSRIGKEIDAPFVDLPLFIKSLRQSHDLRGHSNVAPVEVVKGLVQVDGEPVIITAEMRKCDSGRLTRQVKRSPDGAGGERIAIRANDETEARKILQDINRKLERDGRATIDCDAAIERAVRQTLEKPAMHVKFDLPLRPFDREFAKIALGFGHRELGETWSRSANADILRRFMFDPKPDSRATLGLRRSIWPDDNCDFAVRRLVGHLTGATRHVVAVVRLAGGPTVLAAVLFNAYSATIILDEATGYFDAKFGGYSDVCVGMVHIVDFACGSLASRLLSFADIAQATMHTNPGNKHPLPLNSLDLVGKW